ncbi:uncharacterized protein [Henckelia pumila]|uniref:uncharacterized protein n=1 Tax=Henckelia pumila TaxID=405737 RepID=UPI003C6E1D96
MDPDEVVRLVEELKISTCHEEEQTLTIDTDALQIGEQRTGSCLVAKIFSPKAINREAVISHLPRILQAIKHIEICSVGDNLFILDFKSLQDRKQAFSGGPWNIFRNLIVFRELCGLQNVTAMNFDTMPIWIQCYNLPLVLMHKDFLQKLGSQLGDVEEIDTRENGFSMGKFARLRVRLDLRQPLKKHIRLKIQSGQEDVFVLLSYERLPDFCHNCGIIGHSFRDCENSWLEKGKLTYDSWLKAPLRGSGPKAKYPNSPPS